MAGMQNYGTITTAAFLFMGVLDVHPFVDGNGRFGAPTQAGRLGFILIFLAFTLTKKKCAGVAIPLSFLAPSSHSSTVCATAQVGWLVC